MEATTWSRPVPAHIGGAAAERIALIVPTYRRPADLRRCLEAVASQRRPADQVIVVMRENDESTRQAVQATDPDRRWLTVVTVHVPGVVAALNAGLAAAHADIIAFTDDDAAPHPDWLQRIAARFASDPRVGGVGGRDFVYQCGRLENDLHRVVGRITWFGRSIGHHHLGIGPCREVDALKGVNMSFRATALNGVSFDTRLLGTGAQVCNELGVSLAVKRRGWRLVYDPQIAVDHYPAIRHDEDQRSTFCVEAVHNAAFNEALLLCEHFGWRRYLFMVWALAIGHRGAPGLLQWLRLRASEPCTATGRFLASWRGRVAGWKASR
jgi:cellulose synthase/poly-beta-1,6-N-acetylglucosamine synthase-like glycosyltransferase